MWVENGQLFYDAPDSAWTADLLARIRERKSGLISLLSDKEPSIQKPPLVPIPREGPHLLSFAQQRLWVLHQLEPESPVYNLPLALRLQGPLDVAAFRQSLQALVDRHEILRTCFPNVDGQPSQVIAASMVLPWDQQDLRDIPERTREVALQAWAGKEALRPFRLDTGPVIRTTLLQCADHDFLFMLTLHSIVADEWSLNLIIQELDALYAARVTNQPATLPPLHIQYIDFTRWQRRWLQGEIFDRQLEYWRTQLSEAPASLALPTDKPRPSQLSFRGESLTFTIPESLTQTLDSLVRREGVTLFMVLLATFQILLARYTGQRDLLVGTPISGRTHPELEGLIGVFVNTLVLRMQIEKQPTFREVLQHVRETCLNAYAHQDLPFEKLVDALQPVRDPSRHPVFQIMFQLDNADLSRALPLSNLNIVPMPPVTQTAQFDLSLTFVRRQKTLRGTLTFHTDLFETATIERLARHYQTLLESLVADPGQPVFQPSLLSHAERHQLLVEWNATTKAYPEDRCIHELVEAQVEQTPHQAAVRCGDHTLTYLELNQKANQLAHTLRVRGVGQGTVVPVLMERGPDLVIAHLAVMKTGAAFSPLDPNWPATRITDALTQLRGHIVLVSPGASQLPDLSQWSLLTVDDAQLLEPCSNLKIPMTLDDPIYVMFTSGSTGKPKGAINRHRGIVNRFFNMNDRFGCGPQDTVLMTTPHMFDSSVWQLFWPLINGGRTVIPPSTKGIDLSLIVELIDREQVTITDFVPSVFQSLLEYVMTIPRAGHGLRSLRQLLIGGEAMQAGPVRKFMSLFPGIGITNAYGPTETSIGVIFFEVSEQCPDPIPIGRPLHNVYTAILDPHLQLVPIGVPGDLYVGGACVGLGYVNNEEATNAVFLPNPFPEIPSEKLYKTGDTARYLPDGNIQFIGRTDHQVKIRGMRIELGEIERALNEHPEVKNSVVLAREDLQGGKYLIGYLVPHRDTNLTPLDLHHFLKSKLPSAMVPSECICLEAFPLTTGGKIDLQALPEPDPTRRWHATHYVPPRTPQEELLADIWQDLLHVERIGVHDNFFDLGGHSLLATQVIARVRRLWQLEVPLHTVFEAPTVAEFAQSLEEPGRREATGPRVPLEPVGREAPLPLSFAQQRLWFLHQLEPESPAYNLPFVLRLQGPLDVTALRHSLQALLERHESLRTCFPTVAHQPVQVIRTTAALSLETHNFRTHRGTVREAMAIRHLAEDAGRPFDLAHGPVIRAGLLQLAEHDHVLGLVLHHIATDGWSGGLLQRDLAAFYTACIRQEIPVLPALPIQYADYAVWQRQWLQGEVLERQLAYWRTQLAGVPVLDLPTDRPRPLVKTATGASYHFSVAQARTAELQALSRQAGGSLAITLLAAFQILLARYTGQTDIVVGSPIANRQRTEVEELVGFFVNTLVMRTDLSGDPTIREVLARVREVALGAYDHQDLPFERLVEELHPTRDPSHNPLFQILFAVQNAPVQECTFPGLTIQPFGPRTQTTRFDLECHIETGTKGLKVTFIYNTDLFATDTIKRLGQYFERVVTMMAAAPTQRLSQVSLLSEAERQQVLVEWNDTRREYAQDVCMHALFEAQAAGTPEAVALVFEDQQLTFAELNARANQVAHFLQRHGVGPEVRVGVCLDRSPEMVVALLGILKAGGAYVPLDPSYPQERLAFIRQDAQITVLLTQERRVEGGPIHGAAVVCMDTLQERLASENTHNAPCEATPGNLAYLIYTSGSTGRPKGVAIEHRSAAALLQWANDAYSPEELAGVLASTSICFDLSVFELFVPLSWGGRVILVDNIFHVSECSKREDVRLLNTVPSALAELVRAAPLPSSIRTVNLAGEPLTQHLVKRIVDRSMVQNVYDLYGPSEDTTYSTMALRHPEGSETIGRPLANTQAYLLDRFGHPVPIGIYGELYLGGQGLARGYVNRPDLTAERFMPNPFSTYPGARLYRTGDLARYRADGHLEFLGRMDRQVKLRGYRIELGEIEAVLAEHPAVQAAVAVVREDTPGEKQLVGYVVSRQEAAPTVRDLREFLQARLPGYMVPGMFVVLEALPLTPNGKVDRRALPHPDGSRASLNTNYVAPRTSLERQSAAIWQEVLGLAQVGIHDNFFELGGHSLMAAKIISRMQSTYTANIPLRTIFDSPTIAGLASQLAQNNTRFSEISDCSPQSVPRTQPVPLSFTQERFWLLEQLNPNASLYHVTMAFRLQGALNTEAFAQSLQEIVNRHEILRTVFPSPEGIPQQVIHPHLEINVPIYDLQHFPPENREGQVHHEIHKALQTPFDLAQGPLFRASLWKIGAHHHVLFLDTAHIISDAWSKAVLLREISILYHAFCDGKASPLPRLSLQYADFAVWQREQVQSEFGQRHVTFWKEHLKKPLPELQLPTDFPRPAIRTYRGSRLRKLLALSLSAKVRNMCQEEHCTMFMLLLSTLALLISRYTGDEDIVIGAPTAGRNRLEWERLIGCFLNTVALRIDLSGNPTFRELLRRVRQVALDVQMHEDMPFEILVEVLEGDRDLSRSPLFQVFLNMHEFSDDVLPLAGIDVSPFFRPQNEALFDLTLYFKETKNGFRLTLNFNVDLFSEHRSEEFLNQLCTVLEEALDSPDRPIHAYSMVSSQARTVLPDPKVPLAIPPQPLVLQSIAEWARRTPTHMAIRHGHRSWTYQELMRQAHTIGRSLLVQGLQRGDVVAICGSPSFGVMAGLLGVLHCGGVLLLIDPTLPPKRQEMMLEEANTFFQLMVGEISSGTGTNGRAKIHLKIDARTGEVLTPPPASLQQQKLPSQPPITQTDPAYIFFTSGTFGTPKAILGTHQGLSHFLTWQKETFAIGPDDRIAQLTGLSFDVVLRDILLPFISGGTLCIPEETDRADGSAILHWLKRERITVLHAVPAVVQNWLVHAPPEIALSHLRWVFFAGEPLTDCLIHVWRKTVLHSGEEVNFYGPTETTLAKAFYRIPANPPAGVQPIGIPLPQAQLFIMTPYSQCCGLGEIGQIVIRTPFRTLGYLNAASEQAERFRPNPFTQDESDIWYWTGDLGRYRLDGTVEILGRCDDQVKIRGVRVEPNEVMHILGTHQDVFSCYVLGRKEENQESELVAYVVPAPGKAGRPEMLRKYLEARLPGPLIPTAWVIMNNLPLTPNGKVDRARLPQPDPTHRGHATHYVPPRTPQEELLADIWQDLLHVEQIGAHDNFFDLGGHSLLATQVIARVRQLWQLEVPLRTVFEAPTVAEFVQALEQIESSTSLEWIKEEG
ncbi:MAG: amino acid adenylation domain-containing protein [Nitrospirales bacterium]|nr:amino acid adenylation domain-containing protein [Nitrospirales bacterium]